jgi:hypothetical protein
MDRYHAGRTEQDTGGKGGIGRTLRDLLVADIRFSSTLGPFAAQDLTQSFFVDFMEREALTHERPLCDEACSVQTRFDAVRIVGSQ